MVETCISHALGLVPGMTWLPDSLLDMPGHSDRHFIYTAVPSLRYDRPKKCPTILYEVNLWPKPVSATGASARHDLAA